MTGESIVTRAFELLRSRGAAVGESVIPRLQAVRPLAYAAVSWRVADSSAASLRNALRREFTVPVAAGVGDVSALLAAANPPLVEFLEMAEVRHPDSPRASTRVGDRSSLAQDWQSGFLYHAVEGPIIYFRNVDGTLDTLSGDAKVVASYLITDASAVTHQGVEAMLAEELIALVFGARREAAA